MNEVFNLVRSAAGRDVRHHLLTLYKVIDHRGSDVRLETGDVLDSLRQPLPYPAPMWAWNTVQAYRWDTTGHINVLELTAVLIFF